MPASGYFQLLAGRQELKPSGILQPIPQTGERTAPPLFSALTWDKCAFKTWQGGVLEIAGPGAAAADFGKANDKRLFSPQNGSQARPISPRGAEPAEGEAPGRQGRSQERAQVHQALLHSCSPAASGMGLG